MGIFPANFKLCDDTKLHSILLLSLLPSNRLYPHAYRDKFTLDYPWIHESPHKK